MTETSCLSIRPAGLRDLPAVNRLIESAIDRWDISARVKRLSIPLLRYHEPDLDCLQMVVAEAGNAGIVGVAAWEEAAPDETPAGHTALLLHGIYVAPHQHRKGVGTRLFEAAEKAASSRGFDGVLVKAQAGAEPFFAALALERVPVRDQRRDYPHRFWKRVKSV